MFAFDRYRRLPLRAKLAANVTLIALVLVVTLVWASLSLLRDDLTRSASEAQAGLLEDIAQDLDDKITQRLHALEMQSAVLGHRVPLGAAVDARTTALDEFFASRPVFDSLFDDVMLLDAHGRVIHDMPRRRGRVGTDLSDRDHVQRVLHDGEALIAEPLDSGHDERPVIDMAVPVRDDTGEVVGVLMGVLRLGERNFLSDIGLRRQGRSGYFALVGVDDLTIAHPRREQLLRRLSANGNPGLDRARHGMQGAVVGADARGEQHLYSYRALTSVPWVLQAVYPASEAYAPLRYSERTLLWLGCTATLGAGLLVWMRTRRLLQPLDDLRRAMSGDDGAQAAAAAASLHADSADVAALFDAYRAQEQRRQAAEASLAHSERRVRDIADNIPALIAFLDRDQVYRFTNQRYLRHFGLDPATTVGRTIREAIGETFYLPRRDQILAALDGRAQHFEVLHTGPQRETHLRIDYVPAIDAAGAVDGFYVMAVDVTDAKQAENRVAFSERRLRAITDNLPALISHFDRDGRYTFANRKVGETFGLPHASLIGRTIRDVRGDSIAEMIEPQLARALDGLTATFEASGPGPDGIAHHHFHATYIPEVDAQGEVQGVYTLTYDITERKHAELARQASERRLQDLIDTIPAMVGYFDQAQRCQFANDTALRTLGVDRADVPGIGMRAALGESIWAQHAPHVEDVLSGGRARFEGKVAFPGREAHYQAHLIPDRDASGTQRGFYLMTFDVTALKEAEHRQARVEAQLRSVTDNLPVLISYVDRHYRFAFLNETFNAWMGIDPAAMLGRPVRDVMGDALFAERESYFQRALAGERIEFETVATMRGGQRHLQTVYVPDVESDGTVAGAFCLSTDVTGLKHAEQQLNLLVRSDALTGLANRYRFNEALPESLARARRSGKAIALMFLDIDRFKLINDRFGHGVGDEALQEFALRLQRTVRTTDLVARLAGDEFVVILEGLHEEAEAQAIARKTLAEIGKPFSLSTGPLSVTTSLGIAYQPNARLGEDGLLARADEALYRAKAAGRNTYCLLTVA